MNSNFFNAFISTAMVGALAVLMSPATKPEPVGEINNQAMNAPLDVSEMMRALESINEKLENQANTDRFDAGGSDGVTNSPTWPTPAPRQPSSPPADTPATGSGSLATGSGSTGSGPAGYLSPGTITYYYSSPMAAALYGSGSNGGYSQPVSYSNVSYRNSFLSNGGGYSSYQSRAMQPSGFLSRVRARTANAPRRASFGSGGVTCVDGVCYPN
jgi:hypothetical protein